MQGKGTFCEAYHSGISSDTSLYKESDEFMSQSQKIGNSGITSVRLTCAIEVSCLVRSKTLVLRFEQIIRKVEEFGNRLLGAGQLT